MPTQPPIDQESTPASPSRAGEHQDLLNAGTPDGMLTGVDSFVPPDGTSDGMPVEGDADSTDAVRGSNDVAAQERAGDTDAASTPFQGFLHDDTPPDGTLISLGSPVPPDSALEGTPVEGDAGSTNAVRGSDDIAAQGRAGGTNAAVSTPLPTNEGLYHRIACSSSAPSNRRSASRGHNYSQTRPPSPPLSGQALLCGARSYARPKQITASRQLDAAAVSHEPCAESRLEENLFILGQFFLD